MKVFRIKSEYIKYTAILMIIDFTEVLCHISKNVCPP